MDNITIVARHLNITEAIKNYALQKANKIKKFFERILQIQITLDIGGDNGHIVEMIVSVSKGPTLVAEVSNPDMYRAIDLVVDKIEAQLKKHKGKIQSRIVRRKKPAITETEGFEGIPETE
ncbi:MAG: ribosome-associated translation inhibitor RaiA [Candidatus Brocadia sp. AMX2]|uniref:Ribosome hibernation promoting factor n=1 Tax=Candidatus Brocadia sinica JPN1 TaxID=1197129 RepID=A0ABQ0JVJ0_9BACT|nr:MULTISPECIES: ribosome-associated translation inhibitor RaiA [Brocadia]KXK30107.1 MAG: sigma-54 modulation protein [Candidatus Brocadia sinica]MBC6930822.1 ribosome-associated translation inhibitor RaiA [Candidatus Brocadia sp.]MBL1167791.1 ribosome-associated translation inhibitor RaiA [Candidatus Brocadia sp. AMX1]NOG41405.1 ribosome-associated translation inhibitor RaiA [Planctomycetota bacterium]KAA0245540.1 MAG: ribosome-associated translation inhibitor RaiA [Candidatus Brocadia sp. AM